jgi:hypothetical protein
MFYLLFVRKNFFDPNLRHGFPENNCSPEKLFAPPPPPEHSGGLTKFSGDLTMCYTPEGGGIN